MTSDNFFLLQFLVIVAFIVPHTGILQISEFWYQHNLMRINPRTEMFGLHWKRMYLTVGFDVHLSI